MWKRFQTLLLLISAVLIASLFWSDMCYTMEQVPGAAQLQRYGIRFINYVPFAVFTFVSFFLCIFTIAYYKQRIMQVRLCILNMLLLTGYQIWLIIQFFKLKSQFTFNVATLFPLVVIILLLLAIRYIWRDEATFVATGMIKKGKKNKRNRRKA